jgi:hypothetical protein
MIATTEREFSTGISDVLLIDKILTDFIVARNKKSIKDLRGKISFSTDYDYKLMRQ